MLSLRKMTHQTQAGFTLLEVLLVVAIIAILAGIVIIAINPGKNLGDTRNSQRQADVNTIINAAYQYSLDNGSVPASITTTSTEICATGSASCTGLIDMSAVTANEKYVVKMPQDPQCSTVCAANGIGYSINKDTNGRLVVTASHAENGKTISVTK